MSAMYGVAKTVSVAKAAAAAVLAVAALGLSAGAAFADTITPNTVYSGNDTVFFESEDGLNGSPSLVKYEFDDGNFDKAEDGISPGSYVSAFTITFDSGSDTSGTWEFDPTEVTELGTNPVLYPTKVLLKASNSYFFVEVPLGDTSGSFNQNQITNNNGNSFQAISHISFYDTGTETVVPIPAAAWLFGSALLGMAGIGYRRNQRS